MNTYRVVRGVLRPVLRLLFRPQVEGAEHIPVSGPVILAGNHLSFADHLLPPLLTDRQVTFLAKAEFFTEPGVRGRFKRACLDAIGTVPLDRAGASAAEAALRRGREVLAAGGVLGIYPEGTRSPDGRLYRGKTGVARLALATGACIVPVAVLGTDRLQPPGARLPRPGRVTVRVGRPLHVTTAEGASNDRATLRAMTDQVMGELRSLSGAEYVDRYAAEVKARNPRQS